MQVEWGSGRNLFPSSAFSSEVPSDKFPHGVGDMSAAGLAHDLSSPLDGTARFVRLAQGALHQGDEGRAQELLSRAATGLERLQEITTDLLVFARSGQISGRLQAVDELLEQAVAVFQHHAAVGCVVIVTDMTRPLPLVEAGNLFQVFCNLIKNSIEAMPNGGRLMITAGAEHGPTTNPDGTLGGWYAPVTCLHRDLVVRFADEGVGIPPHVAHRLFEPGFTTKSGQAGLGLGLAICRQIVERAGGTITAETRPEGGALFTVRLPICDRRTRTARRTS